MTVSFIPSQLATLTQTPLPYTANPRKLLIADLALLFTKIKYLPGIFLPLRLGSNASPWDELYPSIVNIRSIVLHVLTSAAQIVFLLVLPFAIIFPTLWTLAIIIGFAGANHLVVRLLNGNALRLEPSPYVLEVIAARSSKTFDDEYWIYMNGVSVGRDWLQSNINRLSLTFNRQVHGVLNPTDGIVFDLIQCLVQRNLYFATNDIREAYGSVKKALYDDKIKKVVFILHSQGAIEGGLITDWMLAEVPQDNLHRLEIYTFGNAANHFNNPQRATQSTSTPVIPNKGVLHRASTSRAIGHIEHYANEGDFVSQFGVLNSVLASEQSRNRFMGRVFISQGSGHLLNQHYLHSMFTLAKNDTCLNDNEFMNAEVDVKVAVKDDNDDDGREDATESMALNSAEVTFIGDAGSPPVPSSLEASINSIMPSQTEVVKTRKIKVKDLSRLWLYRNGGSPKDIKIERAGTV